MSSTPPELDPHAPIFVVLNVGSGSEDATGTRAVIESVLMQAGREHEIKVVDEPARLSGIARAVVDQASARGGIVVAAGGDGTINAVAQAVLGSGCPFGVLPQGTFNYFSRTHGIPAETEEATRLLLTACVQPVQVGLVNDRVFLVNASLGLYPTLLEDREAYKQQYGRSRLVALWAGVVTLLRGHRRLRLHLEQDGEGVPDRVLRTSTLFIGNNRLQLEQIGINEAPLLEQGRLAAIALRPVGRVEMLWLLLRGAFGQLGDADKVLTFPFERITVQPALRGGRAGRRIKVATDGEIAWLATPLEFRVAPQPLWLLKPEPR